MLELKGRQMLKQFSGHSETAKYPELYTSGKNDENDPATYFLGVYKTTDKSDFFQKKLVKELIEGALE